MLCIVYRLYRDGEKLPKEVVRQHPVKGWLYYGQGDVRGHPSIVTQLLSLGEVSDHLIPQLIEAKLLTVQRGGLMFEGCVSQYYGQRDRQRWWVLPTTHGAGPMRSRAESRPPLQPSGLPGKVTAAA